MDNNAPDKKPPEKNSNRPPRPPVGGKKPDPNQKNSSPLKPQASGPNKISMPGQKPMSPLKSTPPFQKPPTMGSMSSPQSFANSMPNPMALPGPTSMKPTGFPGAPPLSSAPVMKSGKSPMSGPVSGGLEKAFSDTQAGQDDMKNKIGELEKKLMEEREKVLLASLRSKEEEAVSSKVESSIKDIQDKLRRDKREQELDEARKKADTRLVDLERRIAEVSEMQRLAEDRIRQEWVAFKAEEQKRWTSHSLSQEESMRDLRKDMDKLEQRTTTMDDIVQTVQDQLYQTTDTTEKQLQELMNLSNEWLTTYERIMGHGKKTKKAAR